MPEPPAAMDQEDRRLALQRGFIVALAVALSVLFLWMVRDFLGSLFIAGVLGMFLLPLQRWLTRLFRGREKAAAGVILLLTVFVVLLPLLAVLAVVARQAVEVGQTAIPWFQEQVTNVRQEGVAGLPDWLPFRDALTPYQDELARRAGQMASALGKGLVGGLTKATGGALGFALNVVVLLFALFYLLTEGSRTAARALELLPMRTRDRELLAHRVLSTIRATVKGSFVIALIQGTLTGAGLAVAGVPGATFWGAVAGVLSIVPGLGPPLVWGSAAIWLWVTGSDTAAVGLAVWGAAVVGVVDNLLRPALVGQDARMSDLMVLLSTLGGLFLFGAVGIIIGPVIAALFSSAWFIYAESFSDLLADGSRRQPDSGGPDDGDAGGDRGRSDAEEGVVPDGPGPGQPDG